MSPTALVSWVALFWLAVHAIHRRNASRSQTHTLPLHVLSSDRRRNEPHYHLTLRGVHLRFESSGLNRAHDHLVSRLGSATRLKQALCLFYDFGVVLGVLGMIASMVLLAFTAIQLSQMLLLSPFRSSTPSQTTMIVKRTSVALQHVSKSTPSDSIQVHMLIPGLTMPMSELPVLLFGLAVAQAFHEFGHAVSAAASSVSIHSVGASLTLVLPAFFVALPQSLPPRLKARVAAAGALHNATLALLLPPALVLFFAPWWANLIGFSDISSSGVVVTNVEPGSSLMKHLSPGSLILGLDDVSLGTQDGEYGDSTEIWTNYLTNASFGLDRNAELGWCIDTAALSGATDSCCPTLSHTSSPLVCFVSVQPQAGIPKSCLDPIPILSSSETPRCPCSPDGTHVCVRPASEPPILRILIEGQRIILWRGPRDEVFEQVHISRFRPWPWTPFTRSFPDTICSLFSYIRTLSFSLFLFNLLPLPLLDGVQLLRAVVVLSTNTYGLAHAAPSLNMDAERGVSQSYADNSRRHRYDTWIIWIAQSVSSGLLVLCTVLGILVWIIGP